MFYTLLFLDTETSGLPRTGGFDTYYSYKLSKYYDSSRVLQLSYIKYKCQYKDKKFVKIEEITKTNSFINIPNFEVPPNNFHSITTKIIREKGLDIKNVINCLKRDLEGVDYIVGHNIAFDITIIQSEAHRINDDDFAEMLGQVKTKDTMRLSKGICQIPCNFMNDWKYPKLSEMYRFCFKKEISGAHDSLCDVISCADCYFFMCNKYDIL